MKRFFFVLVLLAVMGNMMAQTGYCTKGTKANGGSTFYWENARNFCPILVSSEVLQTMQGKGGIKLDMQVDDTNSHLWLWNGYTSLDANDENSFGSRGGYLDLKVIAGSGWSGMGFINDAGLNMSFLNDNYYLHFGTRGYSSAHNVSLGGVMFSIGAGVMDGKENLGNWKNDDEWYYFDIPVSKLKQMGTLFPGASNYKDNYLTALSGGNGGVELVLENIFLYEKIDPNAENPNLNDTDTPSDGPTIPEPPYVTKAKQANGQSSFDWTDAQNFCPIIVSDDVLGMMQEGGIKLDMQVNDNTSHMWIWDNTYTANNANGANSFGSTGGYIDLTVGSVGWSGVGLINDAGINVSFLDDSYYLHFGTKGAPTARAITLGGVAFSIGDGTFEGNPNVGTWTNDGEWYYFDIPVGYLRQIGNFFPGAKYYADNYLTVLSGGVAGTRMILENVFLYQKKSLASDSDDDDDEEEVIPDGPYSMSSFYKAFDWDNAQNFCPIIVSEGVMARMEQAGVKLDMQVNDANSHLYIWNGYNSKPADGQNSFGDNGGYIELVTNGSQNWSGMGLINDAGLDMSFLADKGYYLHFGTKGKVATHTITLGDVAFCIGNGTMDGHKNLGTWEDDGDWWYFDIPVALLRNMGTLFNDCSKRYKDNYLTALSGGTAGVELILENVFLYQKKNIDNGGGNDTPVVIENLVDYAPSAKATPHRGNKRGIGENAFSSQAQLESLAPGVSWYYNWGATPSSSVASICGPDKEVEFVPMAWNASGISAVKNYVSQHPGVKYVLGFNEPNFRSQANMTPTYAAQQWPLLEEAAEQYGFELVAPALNYADGPISDGKTYTPEQWMDAFIAAYKSQNNNRSPRMDYLALHCYMNDHGAMLNYVETFARKYNKKVWLTEFCAWEGNVSEDQQRNTMIQKLEDLEKSEHVFRYAWFKAVGSHTAPYYHLLSGNSLSELGQYYVYYPTFDADTYYTADEQIPAVGYASAKDVTIGGCTDDDTMAYPVQLTAFSKGASAFYMVDIPEKNTYTLALRMSNRAASEPLTVGVFIDGNTVPAATKTLSPTGKTFTKDAWATEGFNLQLPAGKHKMELRSLSSTDCSLQWLAFFHNEFTDYIDAPVSSADILSVDYYTLEGISIAPLHHQRPQVLIRKTTYSDGSTKVEKLMEK